MHDNLIPHGLCQCGCGERTNLAGENRPAKGHVKGEPVRFIVGHTRRRTPHAYEVRDCGHDTPCWVWIRARDEWGYGRAHKGGRSAMAYAVYWENCYGPVPEGLELDHLCRNPACVNPDHLEPVTHAENMRRGKRAVLRADQVREIRASSGHPRDLATQYGVAKSTIYNILAGRTWKEIG